MSRRRRRLLTGLLIGAGIGVAFYLAFWLNLLSTLQLQSSDFLFKTSDLNRSTEQEGKIVIVAIDDNSLEQLGHFPSWSRSYYADLIDMLAEAEARTVVFDVLFSEPAAGDEQLARSIEESGNVILPLAYSVSQQTFTGAGESVGLGTFIRPLSSFEQCAIALGHANLFPDEDGVVRQLPVVIDSGEDHEPALALAAVAKYLRRPQVIESPIENNYLSFAGRTIPINDANGMLINYIGNMADKGAATSFETVSFVSALKGEVAPSVFYDKIVIVGATASALGDTFWTPTGQKMNGVDIHANAIHTILAGDFLKPVSSNITTTLIMVLALLCSLVVLRLRVLWATALTFLIGAAYLLLAFSFFDKGIILNLVYPPLTILGTFVGLTLFNITAERSEKKEITRTFGRYISPPVMDKILMALEKDELKLGGQQQEATVAFADVRGFTDISENMQSEELVRVLNIYLSTVIQAVLNHGGIINKFGGDSVMVIWNAPTMCDRHALSATKAAIDVQRAVKQLQEQDTELPRMDFGIGINTGEVVAGNIGSEDRLEYSVVGDAVNVAARITSLAEAGKVWVSSNTYELVRDYVVAKPLEPLVIKGKRDPIMVYEVLSIRDESFV